MNSSKPLSRRSFLNGAVGVGAWLQTAALQRRTPSVQAGATRLLYIGTYSSPQGPEGSSGRGKGIYLFEMNTSTGALKLRDVFEDSLNPAWLALDPSHKFLYAANEVGNYQGEKSGAVTAYAIDSSSGRIRKLNTVSSQGAGPAHLSVHPSGKFVFVANYAGGSFAVLAVNEDGKIGAATEVKKETGTLGSTHAASAPPSSFAISGHEATHGHMIDSDHTGRFVLGADLGLDRIKIWKFDTAKGVLVPNSPDSFAVPSGDGPRHFVFHPSGKWFYSLQEEASTLMAFDYNSDSGTLTLKQTLSTLPSSFAGTNFTSEVRISPDGRFLYAANRLHDSISFFSIGASGALKFSGNVWTRGDYPRSFTIDPSGTFLLSCNQRSDAVTTFRINRTTGDLSFTGQYTPIGTPAVVAFA